MKGRNVMGEVGEIERDVRTGPNSHPFAGVRLAACMLSWTWLLAACSAAPNPLDASGLTPLPGGDAHWRDAHYTELTPTLLPPGDAADRLDVQVWAWLPAGALIDLDSDEGVELLFPVGSVLDRVERIGTEVVDVRGTELTAAGPRFHVYRESAASTLVGASWAPGDEVGFDRVRRAFEALSGEGGLFAPGERGHDARYREASLARFVITLDCASCHRPGLADARSTEARTVRRGTDASGMFVPRGVLVDDAPLETYRPRLENDPRFASLVCDDGRALDGATDSSARCADGTFPHWHFALSAALSAQDPHALRVCASRRWLVDHMSPRARARFGSTLVACAASGS